MNKPRENTDCLLLSSVFNPVSSGIAKRRILDIRAEGDTV